MAGLQRQANITTLILLNIAKIFFLVSRNRSKKSRNIVICM